MIIERSNWEYNVVVITAGLTNNKKKEEIKINV